MILTTITAGLLGLFLLITAWRDRVARSFSAVSLAVALWSSFFVLWQLAAQEENFDIALLFIQIAVIWIVFISATFLDFSTNFAETISRASYRLYRSISYFIATVLVGLLLSDIFSGTNWIVGSAGPKFWFNFWPDPGVLFEPFLVYFGGCFIFGFILLLRLRAQTTSVVRAQINYLVFSIAMAVTGGSTLYIIWYNFPFPPLGGILVPIYVIASFYAITKHHLFNLKVITAELLTFSVWAFMFARVLLAAPTERLSNIITLIVVMILGLFIIRSVLNEVRQREKLEELSGELNIANVSLQDLNTNLQKKVDEQTQEVKKAYAIEKKARLEQEELDKAKDQFILTTQHHLRTPLTIIKGFLETALNSKEAKAMSAEMQSYLQKSSLATDRMAHLINDFLNMSQLEVGKSVFNFKSTLFKKIIEEILDELKPEIEKRGLYFKLDFSSEADGVTLNLDREFIKAALYNLIDNAVKYTPSGGVAVTTTVIVHPIEKIKMLHMEIQDTGIGLTPEEIEKLFRSYFQRGEEAEKIYTTGRGMGLVLSRNIIKAHKGNITVKSEGRGKGSMFIVELPFGL